MVTASGSPHRAVRIGSNSAIGLAQARQRPRNRLQLAGNASPGSRGNLPRPNRPDHLLELFFGDLVVEQVVDGSYRGLVAGREAFLLLQGEQAVFADVLGRLAQQLARPLVQPAAAQQGPRWIGADGQDVPPARM